MFAVEDFKKIFDKIDVEGFEYIAPYHNNVVTMSEPSILDPNGNLWVSIEGFVKNVVVYPLFLQRVIEGINRKGVQNIGINQLDCKYVIVQYGGQILVAYGKNEKYFTHRSKNEDQAKEQAIKYVLDQME